MNLKKEKSALHVYIAISTLLLQVSSYDGLNSL